MRSLFNDKKIVKSEQTWIENMKLFALGLTAIALLPLPAIAQTYREPLNAPACFMINLQGRLIDLSRMCGGDRASSDKSASTGFEITADDVCRAFARDIFNAQNEFQRKKAEEGFSYCRKNRAQIDRDIKDGK